MYLVNGIAYPGELLAIMGASGAGKTTLLNILTFQRTKNLNIQGSLYANGEPVHLQVFRQIMAYVNQEDLFIGALTVREHLIFRVKILKNKKILQTSFCSGWGVFGFSFGFQSKKCENRRGPHRCI